MAAFIFKKYGPLDQSILLIEPGPDNLFPLPITIVNTPSLEATILCDSTYTCTPVTLLCIIAFLM